ncbi:hypothetical protein GGF46_001007 [Coemansia sp. RSA 552]|nr:hypothetical protein GGF46_001007 [Coemansia sp. RSA 552]
MRGSPPPARVLVECYFVCLWPSENDPREFLAGVQGGHHDDDEMENEFGGAGNYNQELQTILQDILTHITGRPVTADLQASAGSPQQPQPGRGGQDTGAAAGGGGGGHGQPGSASQAERSSQAHGQAPGPDQSHGQSERQLPGMRTWTSNMGNGQISVSVGSLSPGSFGDARAQRRSGEHSADGEHTAQGGAEHDHGRRPLFIDPEENAPITLGNLMSSLIGALGGAPRDGAGGAGPMFGMPVGNLGDYVWGQNSFDDIITHIMEQNQGVHAPPPASEESIAKLPKRLVTSEEVAKKSECGICMEEYKASDEVIVLPCKHVYHLECIDHWLKMNGTCPICRTRIDGGDGAGGSHSAPPRAHSDMPGSFPPSPNRPAPQEGQDGRTSGQDEPPSSVPPPAPEPMD